MKKYTIQEDDYLINNYHNTDNKTISLKLGRTVKSITYRANSLNLKKNKDYLYNMMVKKNKNMGRDLSYENLLEITKLYKTRAELQFNDPSAYRISLKNGWIDDLCIHMIKTSYSIPQMLLFDLIKKLFINEDIKYNSRKIIKPYELDIFIPKFNIAFEYDGKGWHINNKNDKIKNNLCEKNGIKLIRIVENNRRYEEDIKKQIINKLSDINDYCYTNFTETLIKNIKLDFKITDILNEQEIINIINKYDNIHDFKKNENKLYEKLNKTKKLKEYTSHLDRKQKIWYEEDIKYLIDNYNKKTIDEMAIFLNTSKKSIYIKANRLKLKKRRL